MKAKHTQIVGVESNSHDVRIKVIRKDTDRSNEPETFDIIPTDNGVIIRFRGLVHNDIVVDRQNILSGDVEVQIPFKKI